MRSHALKEAMQRTGRNDMLLQRIAARTGMYSTSLDTVKATLDPFHDTPIDPDGWPDLVTAPSIVQCIKQSVTITAPGATVAAGSTWKVHIWNSPYFNTTYSGTGAQTLTYLQNSSSPPQNNSIAVPGGFSNSYIPVGINIVAQDSGEGDASLASVLAYPANNSSAFNYAQNLTIPLAQSVGVCRVFASGIEVHNTTAELYKGGALMAYRMPLDDESYQSSITITRPTTMPTNVMVIPLATPPINTSTALFLKGTQQWEAKDGAYQVHALHSPSLPNNGTTFLMPSYYQNTPQDTVQVTTGINTKTVTASYPNTVTPSNVNLDVASQQLWTQFDCSGLWITGLTAQTTLVLNWNAFIERFPSQLETDLCLVARMSPEYDIQALEFISACTKSLPVATLVMNNSLGEWFGDVLQAGADYIAPILGASKHPVAQGIATALTGGATMMKSWMKKPKEEKKAINNAAKAEIARLAGGGGKHISKKVKEIRRENKVINRAIRDEKGRPGKLSKAQRRVANGEIKVSPWVGGRAQRRFGPRRENGRM